jgi:hypothetical protein
MGFIHYNCTIAEQAAAVAKVKAHCPGFVVTPVCMKPSDTVSALDNLKVGPSHKQAAVAARGWGHTQAAAAAQGRHGGGGGGIRGGRLLVSGAMLVAGSGRDAQLDVQWAQSMLVGA